MGLPIRDRRSRRRADGVAAIALLAALTVGILAFTAAIVPCGSLDPGARSCERVRIADVMAGHAPRVRAP